MKRSELREAVFLILFRANFFKPDEIEDQAEIFFENEDIFSEIDKTYIIDKVSGVVFRIDEIDSDIDKVSIGWKTTRMSRVDLTILRLAYYEMKWDDSVPVAAAIDEAVKLAKIYGTENSASFINGILAKLV